MESPYAQRVRIRFTKLGQTRWIGHLDLQRAWERSLNRAKMPMAYTQGFNRRPKMQLASALSLGTTSECEVIDLWLLESLTVETITEKLSAKMAPGIDVVSVQEVEMRSPALPTLVDSAVYTALLKFVEIPADLIEERIEALMAQESIMREKKSKKSKVRMYDLKPLVLGLSIDKEAEPFPIIHIRTMAQEGKNGRPDEILKSLEIDPHNVHIHRVELRLKTPEPST